MSELRIDSQTVLHYTDHAGDKAPVVLVHGWPLSGESWAAQTRALHNAGHRVISYDRRGFGESSQPDTGYDYDTMTADLAALMDHLDLRDARLVGFSMGGGEVARYVATRGTERVAKVAFISAVTPYLLVTEDNPDGALERSLLDDIKGNFSGDLKQAARAFSHNFYGVNGDVAVSDDVIARFVDLTLKASAQAVTECAEAWGTTDFRDDLRAITVPTLVVHGDSDAAVPFEVSGKRTASMIDGATVVIIEGGSHGILDSHPEQVNDALVQFCGS